MNNLDSSLEIISIAAAKYASDGVEGDSTIVECLVDGAYEEQIKIALESGHTNILDALCAVVQDSHINAHKSDIIKDILTYSRWELLVQVMSRRPYKKVIQQYLNKVNDHVDAFAYINSESRFNTVYFDFVKWFANYSIGSYERETFTGYIKHAFETYYYSQYKKDIWATLREVDFVKKEVDMKHTLSSEVLQVTEKCDIYVNTLLTNIYLANKLLFQHSGHTLNTIVYDIFHLIINYRVKKYITGLNKKLTTLSIELIDTGLPVDKDNTPMLNTVPKGALSKISNALQMIPKLYEYVSAKKLNEIFIGDLRKFTFSLGKSATSDSNCVWKLDEDTKETQSYIDKGKAISNYANFEILIKGVLSAYTLMECMEARGISIVDIYDPDFFKNIDLIRNLDYLSSLQHKDLILQLQNEDIPEEQNELLDTFDRLVYRRAGSKENNRIDNKIRRDRAYTFGMLKEPFLKQRKKKTLFDTLQGIYLQLAAIPKSYSIFNEIVVKTNTLVHMKKEIPSDMIGSSILYNSFDYNVFFSRKPILAADYLSSYSSKVNAFVYRIPSVDTSIKEKTLIYAGKSYTYSKDIDGFIVDNEEYTLRELEDFLNRTGNKNMQIIDLPKKIFYQFELFPIYLDLHDLIGNKQLTALEKIYSKYSDTSFICKQYHQTIFAISSVQGEFVKFMNEMSNFLQFSLDNEWYDFVSPFVQQFKKKEFDTDLFNLYVEAMLRRDSITFSDLTEEDLKHNTSFTLLKKLIIAAGISSDWKKFAYDIVLSSNEPEYVKNLYREFLMAIDVEMTPVSVFTFIHDYLYLQLLFHIQLRDSFEALFLVRNMEIKSMICEILNGFEIKDWTDNLSKNLSFGFAIDSINSAEILAFLRTVCKLLMAKYKYLITEFNTYVDSCTNLYSDIYNYDTSHTPTSLQEFKAYGDLFDKTRNKTGILELDRLRETCVCDSSGFLMRNGEYLISKYEGSEYYIHRTGNLLITSGDSYKPIRYSEYTENSRESDFISIISNGLSYVDPTNE